MQEEAPVTVPRGALIGALVMALCVIALAATARMTGYGVTRLEDAPIVASRDLRFEDRADGAIVVRDAATQATIDVLEPGRDGFVRVALRGLARTRRLYDLGPEVPFRLTLRSDRRYLLDDPATGRQLDLAAFGAVNAQAFTRLLTLTPRMS